MAENRRRKRPWKPNLRNRASVLGAIYARKKGIGGSKIWQVRKLHKQYYHIASKRNAEEARKNLVLHWYKGVRLYDQNRIDVSDSEDEDELENRQQAEELALTQQSLFKVEFSQISKPTHSSDVSLEQSNIGDLQQVADQESAFLPGRNIYAERDPAEVDQLYFKYAFSEFRHIFEDRNLIAEAYLNDEFRVSDERIKRTLMYDTLQRSDFISKNEEEIMKNSGKCLWEGFAFFHSKLRRLGCYSTRDKAALAHDIAKLVVAGPICYRIPDRNARRYPLTDFNFPQIVQMRDKTAESDGLEIAKMLHNEFGSVISYSFKDPETGQIQIQRQSSKKEMLRKTKTIENKSDKASSPKPTRKSRKRQRNEENVIDLENELISSSTRKLPSWNRAIFKKPLNSMPERRKVPRPAVFHYHQVIRLIPLLAKERKFEQVLRCLSTALKLRQVSGHHAHGFNGQRRVFQFLYKFGLQAVYNMAKQRNDDIAPILLEFSEEITKLAKPKISSGLEDLRFPKRGSGSRETNQLRQKEEELFIKSSALTALILLVDHSNEAANSLLEKSLERDTFGTKVSMKKLLYSLQSKIFIVEAFHCSTKDHAVRKLSEAFSVLKEAFLNLDKNDGELLLNLVLIRTKIDMLMKEIDNSYDWKILDDDENYMNATQEEPIHPLLRERAISRTLNFDLVATVNEFTTRNQFSKEGFRAGFIILNHFSSKQRKLVEEKLFFVKNLVEIDPLNMILMRKLLKLAMGSDFEDCLELPLDEDYLKTTIENMSLKYELNLLGADWLQDKLLSTLGPRRRSNSASTEEEAVEANEFAPGQFRFGECSTLADDNSLNIALEALIQSISSWPLDSVFPQKMTTLLNLLKNDSSPPEVPKSLSFLWKNLTRVLMLNDSVDSAKVMQEEEVGIEWPQIIFDWDTSKESDNQLLDQVSEKLASMSPEKMKILKKSTFWDLLRMQIECAEAMKDEFDEIDIDRLKSVLATII